jgi:hypothetical protein
MHAAKIIAQAEYKTKQENNRRIRNLYYREAVRGALGCAWESDSGSWEERERNPSHNTEEVGELDSLAAGGVVAR